MTDAAIDQGTVLVTGASSGIGMAIARQLGHRAKMLVLVARRVSRLEELAKELTTRHPKLKVEVIACDLGDREATTRLVSEIEGRGLTIDVLVNNAGVGLMGPFDQAERAKVVQMIDLNVVSLTLLTLALVPGMVARGKGGVLNISSGFGLAVMPAFTAYIATKHYVTGFTEALRADLAGTGVAVTQVCPGPVATEFEQQIGNTTGLSAPKLVEISADRCARASIAGLERDRAMVIPGLVIHLLLLVNALSPRFMRRLFASIVGRMARKKLAAVRSLDDGAAGPRPEI